jgi:hypothetical protein
MKIDDLKGEKLYAYDKKKHNRYNLSRFNTPNFFTSRAAVKKIK